jgi:hypothetical protein
MRFKLALPFKLLFLCALLAFAGQAYALSITPDSASWWGDQTSQNAINSAIAGTIDPSLELYKSDFGNYNTNIESGILAGSYQTTFTPNLNPTGAEIVYQGVTSLAPRHTCSSKTEINPRPGT